MAKSQSWEYWYQLTKKAKGYHDYLLPLSVLQLEPADRAVLKIAGNPLIFEVTKLMPYQKDIYTHAL